jgi:hypothetical protein
VHDAISPRWLTANAAAAYLCTSTTTLRRYVREGRVPAPGYPLGPGRPRWDRLALDARLEGKSSASLADQATEAAIERILARGAKRGR